MQTIIGEWARIKNKIKAELIKEYPVEAITWNKEKEQDLVTVTNETFFEMHGVDMRIIWN